MYGLKKPIFTKNFWTKNSKNPSVYAALSHFCVIITRASILRTIPVAFIVYLSPFLVGVDAYIDPRADVGIRPYNINFTNYAVSICKRQEIIPQEKKNSSAIKRGIFLCTVHILQSLFTKPHA